MMKVNEFVEKLIDAAEHKTMYVLGCFGAPLNAKNKERYSNNNSFNRNQRSKIQSASDDTFGFDCVCLIKGILWGWNGDTTRVYGGAGYCVNGVPDVGADTMYNRYCTNKSTDFRNIVPGEAVWMDGHIGVYIGDGKVVESTSKWDGKVMITSLANEPFYIREGNVRIWKGHGRLPWIDYSKQTVEQKPVVDSLVGKREYKVVKGDTLTKIASKYNTTVNAIVTNNLAKYKSITPNHIVTGWTLLV